MRASVGNGGTGRGLGQAAMEAGLADAKQLHANELIHRDHHSRENQDDNDPAPPLPSLTLPVERRAGPVLPTQCVRIRTTCSAQLARPQLAEGGI